MTFVIAQQQAPATVEVWLRAHPVVLLVGMTLLAIGLCWGGVQSWRARAVEWRFMLLRAGARGPLARIAAAAMIVAGIGLGIVTAIMFIVGPPMPKRQPAPPASEAVNRMLEENRDMLETLNKSTTSESTPAP